jgi:hypothetical protein
MNSSTNTNTNTNNNSFEQQVQQWVSIDNQIKLYNEKIRELREKRQNIQSNLIEYAETNKLTNSTIQISDGKLKFTKTNVACPLTFTYLEKTLGTIIKDETQSKKIFDYIKRQREIKVINEIKRFYNK